MPPPRDHPIGLRPLFVNQGAVGSTVLGHLATERALRRGIADQQGVDPTFLRLPAWSLGARLAAHRVPGLDAADLDLHALRWHLAESRRGRRTIERELAARPADVLHVNTHTAALTLGRVMARVPTFLAVDVAVAEWHAMSSPSSARVARVTTAGSRALERRVFAAAAGVLTYSDWAADAVRRACPVARVTTLHPGIDVERFSPASHAAGPRPRLLFVGGRFAEKGGNDLLAALGDDLGRLADLDVVTAEPPAPRAGLTVHALQGEDPRLVELYRRADLVCLPSHADALPWTVLEAMACGAAVLASDAGGLPGLLHRGQGATVPAGDVRALGGALRALLADPARLARMGRLGREVAEESFDVSRQGAALLALFTAAGDRQRARVASG